MPSIELAKAMLVVSHDYGFYRMNNTVMNWLTKKDYVLADNNAQAVFKDADHIRKQSYYKEIVNMANNRPLNRFL